MLKVLLIDQSTDVQHKLTMIAQEYPIELFHVRRLEDIPRYIQKELLDLIISDVALEENDIFPILEEIKGIKRLRTVPIMILTNDGTSNKVMKAAKVGCIGYFLKSLDEKVLMEKIKSVMAFAATHHEERKHIRVRPLMSDITNVQLRDPNTKKVVAADLEDVSLGGMAFAFKSGTQINYIKPKRRIQLRLKINVHEMDLSCVVVDVIGIRCAVQFEKMPLAYQEALSEYVFHRI